LFGAIKEKGAIASLVTKRVPKDQSAALASRSSPMKNPGGDLQEKPSLEDASQRHDQHWYYYFEPKYRSHPPKVFPSNIGARPFPKADSCGRPFYALPMDLEWVDMARLPDTGGDPQRAARRCSQVADPPDGQSAPGI